MRKKNQEGLTVVGLMIALVAFIVILVLGNLTYQTYENFKLQMDDRKAEQKATCEEVVK